MKPRNFIHIALCTLTLATFGCPDGNDEEPEATCTDCEETQNVDNPSLKGLFISGHLGNYRDCPGDGYSTAAGALGPEGDMDMTEADFVSGMCEDMDGDECYFALNCDDAQVTLNLTNAGRSKALGLQVIKIELFDGDGNSRATLPLIGVTDTATNLAFDGAIEVGEPRNLRVDFLGPEDPYTLLAPASGESNGRLWGGYPGIIEITFSAENHDDVIIASSEVYAVPSVDT